MSQARRTLRVPSNSCLWLVKCWICKRWQNYSNISFYRRKCIATEYKITEHKMYHFGLVHKNVFKKNIFINISTSVHTETAFVKKKRVLKSVYIRKLLLCGLRKQRLLSFLVIWCSHVTLSAQGTPVNYPSLSMYCIYYIFVFIAYIYFFIYSYQCFCFDKIPSRHFRSLLQLYSFVLDFSRTDNSKYICINLAKYSI